MRAPMTHLTTSAAFRTMTEAAGSSALSCVKIPENPGMMKAVAMKRKAMHMTSMIPGWIMLMMSFFFTSVLFATSFAAFSRLACIAFAVGAAWMSSRTVRGKMSFSWRIACLKDAPSSRMASAALMKARPMVYFLNCSPTISRARASVSPTRMIIASERMARATVAGLDFFPAPQTNLGPSLIGTPFASTLGAFLSAFLFFAGLSAFLVSKDIGVLFFP